MFNHTCQPDALALQRSFNHSIIMKKSVKNFRHLIALALVISVAISGFALGTLSPGAAFLIVGLWQLSQFAVSKRQTATFFISGLTEEQIKEFDGILRGLAGHENIFKELAQVIKADPAALRDLPQLFKSNDEMRRELRKLRMASLNSNSVVRWQGDIPYVTDDCAKALTSVFVLDCARLQNGLETMIKDESKRKQVISCAASALGIEQRAALTGTDIPLPTIYMPQIVELVFAYGAARKYATVFPLASGLVKLPRLKAGEDDFGYLGAGTAGQSQALGEKKAQAELVTFTANKGGGLIRIPYEIEEDTFIPIGQFLARYIARQFAKMEDKTLFVGDGTSTFANQTGIATYCATNASYQLQLAASKTKPSDATLDDFRNLRSLVSAAVLGNMAANGKVSAAYYLSPTFEPMLRSFNKYPNFVVFEYVNGVPMLDGWPVRWIGVSQSYQTSAAANKPIAFFGDLSYWYLAERGTPRIEVSREVFFATDEIAMRALERIDVEAMVEFKHHKS